MSASNYKKVLIDLYFLLINVDGNVDEMEVQIGKRLVEAEGINHGIFDSQMERLFKMKSQDIYGEAVMEIKSFTKQQQIRAIAWLCITANSDGFMDRKEWLLIYRLYHTELKLDLQQIMDMQKELMANHNRRMVA